MPTNYSCILGEAEVLQVDITAEIQDDRKCAYLAILPTVPLAVAGIYLVPAKVAQLEPEEPHTHKHKSNIRLARDQR